ncbi:uncharacterized protein LOC141906242 [Tubulanus polymorphus]|uniref:uncharacterized protein LOC141906242 n=1 Tax=Tubulanus polymorphus TaxID=672921 RepID=UPI003DA2A26A
MENVDKVRVTRILRPSGTVNNEIISCEIHCFSDASEVGYGSSLYARLEDSDGNVQCSLILGKSRVAPLKRLSIPRLELTAAAMSVRLCNMMLQEIDLEVTDMRSSDVDKWRHVRSAENPADLASRGMTLDESCLNRWLHGPEFLSKPKSEWPDTRVGNNVSLDGDPEVKRVTTINTTLALAVKKFKRQSLDKFELITADLIAAELLIISHVQKQDFPEVYRRLEEGHELKKSRLATILIEDAHRKVGHLGCESILAYLRTRYWMTHKRKSIKSFRGKCIVCITSHSPPGNQKMADLPIERVTPDKPAFANSGADYFGPIEIKSGRSVVKRYGVIFTCLASRAIHLEVAYSLDSDSCINDTRRFMDGVDWSFNPPAGSHFGGVWERLIRSVRRVLRSLMKEQTTRLDDESFHTLLCEVESILNNRPITRNSSDPADMEVLTPNHVLLYKPGLCLPPGLFVKTDMFVKRRWRQIQYLADIFWKRWIAEYIPTLQVRQKWLTQNRNVAVGDIVLVADSTPRNSWAMAKVIEVLPDKYGAVRVVRIKTKTNELIRPIDKLVLLLEVDEE